MKTVYRVQDSEGRGPYKPGFSHKWLDEVPRALGLKPWFEEFDIRILMAVHPNEHVGCGCRTIEQLSNWFSPEELARLKLLGYKIVSIKPDRMLAESKNQVVFVSKTPLSTAWGSL